MFTINDPNTDQGDQATLTLGDFDLDFTLTYGTSGDFQEIEVLITRSDNPTFESFDGFLDTEQTSVTFSLEYEDDNNCIGTLNLDTFDNKTMFGVNASIDFGVAPNEGDIEGNIVWFPVTDSSAG